MSEGRLPLAGIRVLELAQIVAGPFCGVLMAEFGAEVIKVEMPGRGDDLRRMGPSEGDAGYWWAMENRNKKTLTLDLHSAKGQEIVRQLVPGGPASPAAGASYPGVSRLSHGTVLGLWRHGSLAPPRCHRRGAVDR